MKDKFNQFYNENSRKVFGYLLKLSGEYAVASDITQESFTRLWEKYKNTDYKSALIYKIARNAFMDFSRKEIRKQKLSHEPASEEKSQEESVLVQEEMDRVYLAIEKLEPSEKELILLVAGGDLNYADIAEIMEISEANVKVKVHRARVKLKAILDKENGWIS